MIKLIIPALLLTCFTVNGQILEKRTLHPGLTSITTRYFKSNAGNAHWSYEKVDAEGRVVERKDYDRKILLGHEKYTYNQQGDLTGTYVEYDINRPQQKDTTRWFYRYDGNRIVYQKCVLPSTDSMVYTLVSNEQDTLLTYQYISYYNNPGQAVSYEDKYFVTYRNNKLAQIVKSTDKGVETIAYTYYPNGLWKRRVVIRDPDDRDDVNLGGPGDNDLSYEYTYDEHGRKKVYYVIMNGRRYKASTYKYGLLK